MRKLVVLTFVTLDGVMQAPGGPDEDKSEGFKYGGWSFGYWDEILDKVMGEQMTPPFDLLLGRKTYDIFASYWPQSQAEPTASLLNKAKKYVVSKTLKKPTWENSTVISHNVADEIEKLKRLDGPELQVHGSSDLIQTLLKNELVDEFRLKIFPVVLGSGKRLFAEGTMPGSFKLVNNQVSTTGVIVATYRPDGAVKVGSF